MGTKVYDNYEDLITFNRNSKGTALRPIGYGDELVTNGTFDTDSDWTKGTGWSISGGQLSHTAGTATLTSQTISLTLGKVYKATCDVISVSGGSGSLQFRNGGTTTSVTINSSYVGSTVEVLYVAEGNNQIAVNAGSGTDITVDNVSVKEVLFDREGDPLTLFLHPEGVPRIEYDADRNLKGLLIEPEATNLLQYSEEFDDGAWTKAPGVSVTANTDVAPDGTTTADTVTSGANQIDQAVSCSTSTTYTDSLYFKKTTGATYTPGMYLIFTGGTFIIYAVVLNTDTGVATAVSAGGFTTPDAFSVSDQGDYWRLSITGSSGNNTTVSLRLYPNLNAFGTAGAGSQIVWGAQLEEGPIATSYIKRITAIATRGKDEASMTNVSGLIGQTEGTLYVEVDWRLATGIGQELLSTSDGTTNNRVLLYKNSGNELRMYAQANGGSSETDQGVDSSGFSGIQKIAFAYKTDDFELYRNGSSISSDTSGSLAALATLTDIDLGQNVISGNQVNMWIRAVQIIPRRLSDEQLIELTS